MKWKSINSIPAHCGWFYVRDMRGTVSIRYFDDTEKTWWFPSRRDGIRPNNSFVEWLSIKGVSDKQRS